jgi:hypothetical protein
MEMDQFFKYSSFPSEEIVVKTQRNEVTGLEIIFIMFH